MFVGENLRMFFLSGLVKAKEGEHSASAGLLIDNSKRLGESRLRASGSLSTIQASSPPALLLVMVQL